MDIIWGINSLFQNIIPTIGIVSTSGFSILSVFFREKLGETLISHNLRTYMKSETNTLREKSSKSYYAS